jgi:hypothetical protein
MACVPVHRGFNSSLGYLSGAEDHVDQSVAASTCHGTGRECTDNATGGGCIDMWRDDRPAHGENGTYNDYVFTAEAERIIAAHPKSKPLFIYQAFQNVHGPYEVPQKYRDLFPPDESCSVPGGSHDCCTWTERSLHDCKVSSKEGVCKCPNDQLSFQPPSGFHCPPVSVSVRFAGGAIEHSHTSICIRFCSASHSLLLATSSREIRQTVVPCSSILNLSLFCVFGCYVNRVASAHETICSRCWQRWTTQ